LKPHELKTLQRFYRSHRQGLLSYALSLTGNRDSAEDAIHTAFAKLLHSEAWPRELSPYMYRAVRNEALQERRHANREPATVAIFDGTHNGRDHESEDLLNEALKALRDEERESVVLKGLNGLTLQEVAEVHSVSINTAASWYRRGMTKLRERLEELERHE